MSSVVQLQDSQFSSEVIESSSTVLAYFWANWCGPCRLVSPSIEWVASEYADRLKVVKLEVDPCPDAVKQCKVEGVPALRLFKEGEPIATLEGAITKQKLAQWLDSHLG
jgi:thioredoxin 1